MQKVRNSMNTKCKRILMSIVGVTLCGMSAGIYKYAAFGVDPFQCFVFGVDAAVPIAYGTLYVLLNAGLLIFSLLADRRYVGLATVLNMLFLGYVLQFTHDLLARYLPAPMLWQRLILMAIGFTGLCFSLSLYITADLGVSTYDAIALIISRTWGVGQFRFVRILTDFACVAVGCALYLLGGNPPDSIMTIAGPGTILCAACMGPLIDWFNRRVSIPLLHRQGA